MDFAPVRELHVGFIASSWCTVRRPVILLVTLVIPILMLGLDDPSMSPMHSCLICLMLKTTMWCDELHLDVYQMHLNLLSRWHGLSIMGISHGCIPPQGVLETTPLPVFLSFGRGQLPRTMILLLSGTIALCWIHWMYDGTTPMALVVMWWRWGRSLSVMNFLDIVSRGARRLVSCSSQEA